MKKPFLALCLLFVWNGLFAQNGRKIPPIFPPEIPGLVYLEGEDAVSTNFASEATLDYSSSGLRILQLNQGPQAPGAPFFAEYVFYVEEAGTYELWLGGTPPGPKDDLLPSFASPYTYRLDDKPPVSVYREDSALVENYTPTNSWNRVKTPLNLEKGTHTLRLEVSEKRRYDNKYYFFLDALFLLKTGIVLPTEGLPSSFPKNLANRSLDSFYLSVAQYEVNIQNSPKVLAGYLQLASVYSLLGDYQNALKVLSRARVNTGENPAITLLMAKNRLWSGEVEDGLNLYRDYLAAMPNDLAVWAEAGKVIAWQGQYPRALDLYAGGLKTFPDDLNLRVNYGLTFLWANRIKEGEDQLDKAWELAKLDEAKIKTLAQIYWVNGYPQKTIETYQKALTAFPGNLSFFLLLEEAYVKQGQNDKAEEVKKSIQDTFEASDQLASYLQEFEIKESLRQTALDGYKSRLSAHPDDLKLREELVQAYFWNGSKDKAIQETWNILTTKLYQQFQDLDKDLLTTFKVLDWTYLARGALVSTSKKASAEALALKAATDKWKAAVLAAADPTKGQKAQDDLTAAQADFALETARAEALTASFLKIQELAGGLLDQAQPEIQKITEEKKTLAARAPWIWDRQDTLAELGVSSKSGDGLADYLLARLYLAEQSPALASVPLGKLQPTETSPPSFVTIRLQAGLWNNVLDADSLTKGPYYPYAPDLVKAFQALDTPVPDSDVFSDSTDPRAENLLKNLVAFPGAAALQTAILTKSLDQLHQRLLTRMQIQFYQYDLDSTDLRFQLGTYYLDQNRPQEARAQLERVLVLNPGSALVQFNLARARQLSGDWSGAMSLYKSVYLNDPKFETAATSYNQLAKLHADRISTQFTSFQDNARATTESRFEYQAGGSSLISLNSSYTLDQIHVYQNSATVVASTANLHTLDFSPILTLADWNLTLRARVGGTLENNLFNFENSSTSAGVLPGDLINYAAVSPLGGLGAQWVYGPLTLKADYTFDQMRDTFLPFRQVYFENKGEATASLFYALPSPSLVTSVSSRTYALVSSAYGPFSLLSDLLYTGLQEVYVNFQVTQNPWTILVLSGLAEWDDSTFPLVPDFYSPDKVLTLKGGVQLSTWLGLSGGWVLGASGRAAFGTYTDSAEADLLTEGEGRFELSKGDLSIFLDLSATLSTRGSITSYWTTQAYLGVNLSLPDYIIR